MPAADYPGRTELDRLATEVCERRARQTQFVADLSTYELVHIVPTEDRWRDGERTVHCLVTGTGGTLFDSELPNG